MRTTALFQRLAFSVQRIVIVLILLSTFYFLLSAAPTYAQSPSPNSGQANYPVANTNPDVSNTLHNWTQNVMIEVMSAMTCQLTGVDPTNPKGQCLGVDQKTGKIGFVPNGGGAVAVMGSMISMLYTPPLHTGDYFQNLAQNFGISKKAYAQITGTGFKGLSPLLPVWSAFRNIVYLVFVLVFVAIGLAIMLRVKIDPRTVMTIQNQIPKIIIGLLLVTFSFAIAGFLVDLMWVLIYLVYGLFSGIQVSGMRVDTNDLNPALLQGKSALGAVGGIGGIHSIAHSAANSTKDAIGSIFNIQQCVLCVKSIFNPLNIFINLADPIGTGVTNWLIDLISSGAGVFTFFKVANLQVPHFVLPLIGDILNSAGVGGVYAAAGTAGYTAFASTETILRIGLPYFIAYLIIFIALLWALFRLWFMLILAYVWILLDVVYAPFWILGSLIPGNPISFGGWLRDLAANLIAFPTAIMMFLLAKVFMEGFEKASPGFFAPPLIGSPMNPETARSFVGLGIILLTPTVVDIAKKVFKAPKIDLSGVGQAIGVGAGAPMSGIKGGMAYLTPTTTKDLGAKGGIPAVLRNIFRF